jgi:hypothetical protein
MGAGVLVHGAGVLVHGAGVLVHGAGAEIEKPRRLGRGVSVKIGAGRYNVTISASMMQIPIIP